MRRSTLWTVVAVFGIPVAFGLVHWPRINDVETGRAPEYPDLQPRVYAAREDAVARAARAAIDALPGWTFVGAGRGPAGSEIQALATVPPLPLKHEVTIRLRREGAKTRVTVRSRGRVGPVDLGQNAR